VNSLEQVAGWSVNGRYFSRKEDAAAEKARLDFFDWVEAKHGKNGLAVARSVWADFIVTARTPINSTEGNPP